MHRSFFAGAFAAALMVFAQLAAPHSAHAQFAQQGPALVPSDRIGGGAAFATATSLSADGNTLLAGWGFENSGRGGAWIFTRDPGTGEWSQVGSKLYPNDPTYSTSNAGVFFGSSVALSADGNTAYIAGSGDHGGINGNWQQFGAFWIFDRDPGTGEWSQRGTKIRATTPVESGGFGTTMALSADGNTLMIGGPTANHDGGNLGYVWVFARDQGTGEWSEQASPFFPDDTVGVATQFGSSMKLSADGNTAIIGGWYDDYNNPSQRHIGAAWIYTRNGTTWSKHTKLTPTGATGQQVAFGSGVGISADGNTVFIGGPWDNFSAGTVWIYDLIEDVWTQQHKIAMPSGFYPSYGTCLAVAADGKSFVATGSTYADSALLYTKSGNDWVGPASFSGVVGSNVPCTADISADASTFANGDNNSGNGKTRIFTQALAVGSVSPDMGPLAGGTNVTINGSGFTGATEVTFGGNAAANVVVVDPTHITATTPANLAGSVDVVVANASGSRTGTGAFTYVAAPTILSVTPAAGPAAGGTTVTITGTDFITTTAVTFGGNAASFTVDSPTQITATSPAGADAVTLVVTTAGGTASDSFTYVPLPAVTSVSPAGGPLAGGTTVIIIGTNLSGATAVTFGASAATGFTVNSATQITATAPAGTDTVNITVTTAGGTSATGAANQFTYVPAPTITSVSPAVGPLGGGSAVMITGTNLSAASAVAFGATPAAGFIVNSATSITATSPAGTGTVNVTVTTAGGTSATSSADQFTYIPAPVVTSISPTSGPAAGGTTVIITGTNLADATDVEFGSANATSFTSLSNTSISAVTPAGSGAVAVRVSTAGGTHDSSVMFTYIPRPTITAINPNQGPAAGGTLVSIVGTNLTGATSVRFGSTAATSFSASSATTATATAPPGTAGAVNVTIVTPGGTSAGGAAARFTYTANPKMTQIAKFAGGKTDGGKPFGTLVADKTGALYGTTSMGGSRNKGVIFKLVPKANPNALWTKTILHHFEGDNGAKPYAGLAIDNAGNLYGTTTMGGTHNKGVVFKYTAANKKMTVLYSFKGAAADGGVPYGGLARDAQGVLYGFTSEGGRHDSGTAFEIATANNNRFSVTQHFTIATGDNPRGTPVLDKQGNVYGSSVDGGGPKNGLVFKIAPNNTRTTLYTFKAANTDGHHPLGPLFTPGGNGTMFFGTTLQGGAQNKGVIFDVMPPSTGIMLYAFTGPSGANPQGGVVADAKTILYGTTFNGGAKNKGVVFKLIPPANNQPTWTHELMYSFKGGAADGANPYAGILLGKNSTLYGTTSAGGATTCTGGCGNAFKVEY